jgi:hypothetical protein
VETDLLITLLQVKGTALGLERVGGSLSGCSVLHYDVNCRSQSNLETPYNAETTNEKASTIRPIVRPK